MPDIFDIQLEGNAIRILRPVGHVGLKLQDAPRCSKILYFFCRTTAYSQWIQGNRYVPRCSGNCCMLLDAVAVEIQASAGRPEKVDVAVFVFQLQSPDPRQLTSLR